MQGARTRFALTLFAAASALHLNTSQAKADDDDDIPQGWQESEVVLPAPPKVENFLPFYVSAVTDNRFFVDGASISVGNDGVVRYTLVVDTANGVRNVSYEGMRCESRERRIYALGRPDGTWSKVRSVRWERVTANATINRQYAALFVEYFCPIGTPVASANEAITALKKGSHFLATPNRSWP